MRHITIAILYDPLRARTAYNIAFPARPTSWDTSCPNMIAFGSVLGVLGAAPERFLFIMMGKMVEVGEGRSVTHVLREIKYKETPSWVGP